VRLRNGGPGRLPVHRANRPGLEPFPSTASFEAGKPWLLRFFDQIRFYPVSAEQLLRHREDFIVGKFNLAIQEETFRLRDYHTFLGRIAVEATSFKTKQQAAFEAERERWKSTEFVSVEELSSAPIQEEVQLPEHGSYIDAPVAGNLWSTGWKTLEYPDRPSSSLSILSTSNIQGYVSKL
jgi:urea carboxylase